MRLTEFKALTFDVYGTLIDWESGMLAGLKPLTDQLAGSLGCERSGDPCGRQRVPFFQIAAEQRV